MMRTVLQKARGFWQGESQVHKSSLESGHVTSS